MVLKGGEVAASMRSGGPRGSGGQSRFVRSDAVAGDENDRQHQHRDAEPVKGMQFHRGLAHLCRLRLSRPGDAPDLLSRKRQTNTTTITPLYALAAAHEFL